MKTEGKMRKKKGGKRRRKERRGKGRKEKYRETEREKERGAGGTTLIVSEKEGKSKIHFWGRPLQLVRNRK